MHVAESRQEGTATGNELASRPASSGRGRAAQRAAVSAQDLAPIGAPHRRRTLLLCLTAPSQASRAHSVRADFGCSGEAPRGGGGARSGWLTPSRCCESMSAPAGLRRWCSRGTAWTLAASSASTRPCPRGTSRSRCGAPRAGPWAARRTPPPPPTRRCCLTGHPALLLHPPSTGQGQFLRPGDAAVLCQARGRQVHRILQEGGQGDRQGGHLRGSQGALEERVCVLCPLALHSLLIKQASTSMATRGCFAQPLCKLF